MPDAVIDCYGDLVDALAARRDEIGLSNAFVEAALHLGDNCLDKILGPSRAKGMSVATAFDLAMLMGCRITLTVDPELEARMRDRWEQRDSRKVHPPRRISAKLMALAKPLLFSELGRVGGRRRVESQTASQRSESARTAALSRWRKHRAAAKARATAEASP